MGKILVCGIKNRGVMEKIQVKIKKTLQKIGGGIKKHIFLQNKIMKYGRTTF